MAKNAERISEEWRDRVRRWLTEEGHEARSIPGQGARWGFYAKDFNCCVGQWLKARDKITLSIRIGIKNAELFLGLPEVRQTELLDKLAFYLMSMNVDFFGLEPGTSQLIIEDDIYYDALTKDEFYRRLRNMYYSTLLTSKVLQEINASIALNEDSLSPVN